MKREELNFFLQKVPEAELGALCEKVTSKAQVALIQKPTQQTLLLPVKDPITNGEFISGEVLVTSAIVQVNSVNGWAMVMDQQSELARLIATLDGAFAAGVYTQQIIRLVEQGKDTWEDELAEENQKVEDTRVSFDLM